MGLVENEIGAFLGEGGYDSHHLREKLADRNEGAPPKGIIPPIIPPRKQAVKSEEGKSQRDRHIQYMGAW